MKRKTGFLLIVLAMSGAGCQILQPVEMPSCHYYLNDSADFATVGKVALLELDNSTTFQDQTQILTQSLADGLGKKHLFSVRVIWREDSAWGMLNLDSIHEQTNQQLAEIREKLGVDAVLFGAINRYSSYPHFLAGLHLKMVDLRNAKILWAMEEVWDSTDKATEQRMKRFFASEMRSGYEPLNWQVLENSPRYFDKFVIYEVTQTLPELQTCQNPSVSSENVLNFSLNPKKWFSFQRNY